MQNSYYYAQASYCRKCCDDCSGLSPWLHLGLTKTQVARSICEGFFFLIKSFEMGRSIFNPGYTCWQPKGQGRKKLAVFACLPSLSCQVHSFSGIRACFFGILAYTEDQIRLPASWTEKLLDSWTLGRRWLLIDRYCWGSWTTACKSFT